MQSIDPEQDKEKWDTMRRRSSLRRDGGGEPGNEDVGVEVSELFSFKMRLNRDEKGSLPFIFME